MQPRIDAGGSRESSLGTWRLPPGHQVGPEDNLDEKRGRKVPADAVQGAPWAPPRVQHACHRCRFRTIQEGSGAATRTQPGRRIWSRRRPASVEMAIVRAAASDPARSFASQFQMRRRLAISAAPPGSRRPSASTPRSTASPSRARSSPSSAQPQPRRRSRALPASASAARRRSGRGACMKPAARSCRGDKRRAARLPPERRWEHETPEGVTGARDHQPESAKWPFLIGKCAIPAVDGEPDIRWQPGSPHRPDQERALGGP